MMILSDFTVDFLGEAVAGDLEGFRYRTGPALVKSSRLGSQRG
ncbi:hypothetical protein [Demequina sp.]|nr:hypothetical protein [Demequina sp.]